MRAEIIRPSDARWADALARVTHDVYHLPGYAALDARREGGEPIAVLATSDDGFLLQPLITRRLPARLGEEFAGMVDAVSPYGYSGPLFGGPRAADAAAGGVRAMVECLRDEGVISAFVRLHPLHDYPGAALAEAGAVLGHGPTVWIDLTRDEEELWGQIRPRVRTYIRRMLREGYRAVVQPGWDSIGDFAAIYTETMQRVGADPGYFFDRVYFDELRDGLGDTAMLVVVMVDGDLACAGIFTEVSGVVEYHLGGTSERFRKLGPTRLLFHHMAGWAKGRGNRTLHLGGGVGAAEDSLFHFKAGFSPLRAEFRSWRLITDAGAVASAATRAGSVGSGGTAFFPPYRAGS